MSKKKFAVFASGNGSNLQVIIEAVERGDINAELALVFSDRSKAFALKRAQQHNIPTLFFNPKNYTNKQSFERDIVIELKKNNIDFIVLAGYMRILTAFFIKEYKNKILNVHPSLLPAFKGATSIKDAFLYGAKITGVTIHFVNEKIDHGPIILQEPVNITKTDTLESLENKIHKVEHKIYLEAIQMFVEDKLVIKGRKVIVDS